MIEFFDLHLYFFTLLCCYCYLSCPWNFYCWDFFYRLIIYGWSSSLVFHTSIVLVDTSLTACSWDHLSCLVSLTLRLFLLRQLFLLMIEILDLRLSSWIFQLFLLWQILSFTFQLLFFVKIYPRWLLISSIFLSCHSHLVVAVVPHLVVHT